MRLVRAIDRFLEQMILEQDWTARTVDSVYRTLVKLADDHPDATLATFEGRRGTDILRAFLGRHFGHTAASTRSTRISYLHSFWSWAETEGLIDDDPARRIKRPPKRKPNVYRPSGSEMALLLLAARPLELAALLLMSGAGLRASEIVNVRWQDVDLLRGRVRVRRKGQHWQWVPVDPLVWARLRALYRQLEPDQDDHVFVAETERWASQEHRVRTVIDPKTPRTTKTLWRMVGRVAARAGARHVGPHALRRGFANEFLAATRDRFGTADVWTLQLLMGHSRIDTTEKYLTDLAADEAADVLQRLRVPEDAQASPGETTTSEEEVTAAQTLKWRRRELNPRPSSLAKKSRSGSDSEDDDPDLAGPKERH